MRRAVKITLKFATQSKRDKINNLLEAYRAAVNFYIRSLWNTPGRLDKETLARLDRTRLSARYKSQALKQALETVVATKKSAKTIKKYVSIPKFHGSATLDSKFVTIEEGHGSFDLIIRLSTLNSGQRIVLPTRKTRILNKWLAYPGARLIQGCSLSENQITLFIELPDEPLRTTGSVLGIDLGINKLVSTSDGNHYGRDFKLIRNKINRRKPGSKGRKRAYAERTNYIGRTLNQLPWNEVAVLGVEALHDMKRGKKPNRGKTFRRALAPWTYRQAITRIGHKAQENRVRLVAVDPRNTSRTCPASGCGTVSKENRRGENFVCVSCSHTADSDTVGAQNVLARTLLFLGSVESPRQNKAM